MKYVCNGSMYEIRPIDTYDMIDTDMMSVLDTIGDTDINLYMQNMRAGVDQGKAYDIWKDGTRVGFVYNREEDGMYYGSSINIWDHIGMILGMKHMFEISDKHKIVFVPHGDNWKYFKSMVQGNKLRMLYNGGNSVTILRDEIAGKYDSKLMKYLQIEVV